MSRRLSTALLFATALALLPPGAHAGFKPGGGPVHPIVAPNIHPIHPHAGIRGETHRKPLQAMHKLPRHHHHKQDFGWGLPFTTDAGVLYGSYYDPADQPGEVDPALFSDPYPGSPRGRAFYRTGCRSEEVSVPSSHGPTRVTVTRCSVPIPEPQPPK
jgi:hypothetical protein